MPTTRARLQMFKEGAGVYSPEAIDHRIRAAARLARDVPGIAVMLTEAMAQVATMPLVKLELRSARMRRVVADTLEELAK